MPLKALQGVRVIDAAEGVAGPFCAKLLADYGAEVIKVERPGAGDPVRREGPFPDGIPHLEKSALFLHLNANKKGITLDLESAAGQELFRRLVRDSHVLVESGRPGRMESLSLGYRALAQLRPELVMTSITPFGQTGPHRDYQFTELTIFAVGGGMYREGTPEREPLKYAGETAQYFAGTTAAVATMAASFQASLTGQGEWIDLSIQESMAGHPHQIGRRASFAYSGDPDPRRKPHTSFVEGGSGELYASGTFRCRDGYVSLLPLGPRMWPSFTKLIDRPELAEDPRYSSQQDRRDHHQELQGVFQRWLDTHTREQVFVQAQRVGLPCAPVLAIDEVMANGHFAARGYFLDIGHPDAGELTYTGLPFNLSDAPREDARPAPRLGQHNEDVLRGILGVSPGEMARLRRQGAI